jgi:hypothetical protein
VVDRSNCPCKKCGHLQKDHSKIWSICYDCKGNYANYGFCIFERPENLKYLEWVYEQKESKDE